jgi:hypothetical protein
MAPHRRRATYIPAMAEVVRVCAVVAGVLLALGVLRSAIRTVVLPRSEVVPLTRAVFVGLRKVFDLMARDRRSYDERDRVMASYAPLGLMLLAAAWAVCVMLAFTLVFWGLGVDPLRHAFVVSGSSFTTLGFAPPRDASTDVAAVGEAVVGLGLVALLISFLPSIYGAFQRREVMVSMLQVRAGSPPSGVELIVRHHAIGLLGQPGDRSTELFQRWEEWFADIEESHTSQGSLPFFRSPRPHRHWITASGAVLDGAALQLSTVDGPPAPEAALCLRAGYLSLRHIADFFGIAHDADPKPDDPISIGREEFDDACRRMADAGVPLKADLEQAWRDFAGWRVNYDRVLVTMAGFFMAPYAPWSSDRSIRFRVHQHAIRGMVERSTRVGRRILRRSAATPTDGD